METTMMIISNICHHIHSVLDPTLETTEACLGHSFICIAAVPLTMQNNFFHSLKIGNIAKGTNNVLRKKRFSFLRPTVTTRDGGLLADWKLWAY